MLLKLMPIFLTVFLAELGDKTQLATVLFASDRALHPVAVFLAASAALLTATGLAVLVGHQAARYLDVLPIKLIAGLGFVAIGLWFVVEHLRQGA
jgi:putative Ca2+/H+ antiporter (TMEM165/GDT1 family)